jgi:hypothetical protein
MLGLFEWVGVKRRGGRACTLMRTPLTVKVVCGPQNHTHASETSNSEKPTHALFRAQAHQHRTRWQGESALLLTPRPSCAQRIARRPSHGEHPLRLHRFQRASTCGRAQTHFSVNAIHAGWRRPRSGSYGALGACACAALGLRCRRSHGLRRQQSRRAAASQGREARFAPQTRPGRGDVP